MQKKGSLLVVDDDPGAREAIRSVLCGEYEVHVAEGAAQALQILRLRPIDTVTLEPWLAGVQGREILTRIREAGPSARVVIVTGQRLSLWFDDMVREEIFDYLPKPFDRRDLLRTIERSLARRERAPASVLSAADLALPRAGRSTYYAER